MMNCERAKEHFSGLHEGTLSKGLAEAVRHHLANCASCEVDFREFSALCSSLSALPSVEPPPALHERVMRELERALWVDKEAQRPLARLARWRFALAVGALSALLITAVMVYRLLPRSGQRASVFPSVIGPLRPAPPAVFLNPSGGVNLVISAYETLEAKVFQGGSDFSTLPPKDAVLLFQKTIPSGENFQFTVKSPSLSTGASLYWMETNIPGRISLVIVPPAERTASQKVRTDLIGGLKALSEAYGVVIDALVGSNVPDLELDTTLPSAVESAESLLKNWPYSVSLQGGILRIR